MARHLTIAAASVALALSVGSPAPAQAGILSWLVAGAGAACAASDRCSARAHAARDDVAARVGTGCASSAGCTKLARDASDLRAHLAQGGRGLMARLFARPPASGTVANPFASQAPYGYGQR